ncbi:unnamed protein product [Toxocara canis]|uniref:VWFD domain-containing protein n=1 Tax=Toxocara canis TaxID=6265 RepID=A0A183U8X9_TOXCA|nr:unnamed protein product [Toxocara canis]
MVHKGDHNLGVAYVIAPDRFITFDGRVFAFHAPCDYLLATDFIDQQFALIGNFVPKHGGTAFDSIKAEIRGDIIVMHMDGRVEEAQDKNFWTADFFGAVTVLWGMAGALFLSFNVIDVQKEHFEG